MLNPPGDWYWISNIVKPVPPGTKRPLWSVMIPTFNPNEKFLIESINSVIIQDPGPDKMQIEVVDDCSTKVDIKKIIKVTGMKNFNDIILMMLDINKIRKTKCRKPKQTRNIEIRNSKH